MIKVIHGQIYSEDFSKLEQLASIYSSCVRWCYVKFKQEPREFNEVRNLAKVKYITLNTRQISDAVNFHDDSESLSSKAFLQEPVVGSNCNNDLGRRKTTLQSRKIFQLC